MEYEILKLEEEKAQKKFFGNFNLKSWMTHHKDDIEKIEYSEELTDSYKKEYSEDKFWGKLRKVGTNAGVTPIYYGLLVYHAITSPNIPMTSKLPLMGGAGYLISFIDAIPDITPLVGYCDDAAILVGALIAVTAQITDEIREEARMGARKLFPNITDEEFEKLDSLYRKTETVANATFFINKRKKEAKNNIVE